jgi:hypothetical protein
MHNYWLLQRLLMSVLGSDDDSRSPKEAVCLLTIITTLTKQLGVGGEKTAQVISWLHRICTEQSIGKIVLLNIKTHFQ